MKCHRISAFLAVVWLTVSPVLAQTRSDEVQRLRDEMQSLQEKLGALERGDVSSVTRERTTQLGRSRMREEEPELVVRIYDLSDLLAPISAYPALINSDLEATEVPIFPTAERTISAPSGMSGAGGMGGGMMSVPSAAHNSAGNAPHSAGSDVLFQKGGSAQPSRTQRTKGAPSGTDSVRIDLDGLIDAITSTIEPTTWDDVGGPGSIAALGNSLIISTTPKTHDQITVLLDSFRKRWGTLRTVSVQADWLWLTDSQLSELLEADAKAKPNEPRAFGLVDDAAWQAQMKERSKADDSQRAGYQAAVTCYNGQTVHTVSGRQQRFITGMIPVVGGGDESSVGYQPMVATLQEGAALQVTPMTTTGGRFIVLDVHSRVLLVHDNEARQPANPNWTAAQWPTHGVVAAVDRPVVTNSNFETTLRVPVDRRMLVGGMTFSPRPKHDELGLYLFVKLQVQELRDDLAPAKAEPKPTVKATTPPGIKVSR